MQERDLIEQIRQLVGTESADVLQGIGDDCAVVEKNATTVWLISMDTLVETVHFDLAWHPASQLGRKAVSVNVSDIAAMGGKPCFVLLSLGLPTDFAESWTTGLMEGIRGACSDYGCLLIGGDTVCSPGKAVLTLTVIGEMAREKVIYRHGAKVGDVVWVSGSLGNAAAGLDLFKSGSQDDLLRFQPLLDAHLDPTARVELGGLLAQSQKVHAMMDLSDGLATDLSHLCRQSNVGARIMADQLPGQHLLREAAELLAANPVDWMIAGGEDYELLFTAAVDDSAEVNRLARQSGCSLSAVGRIVDGCGVVLKNSSTRAEAVEQIISYQGYDHFKRKKS